MILNVKALPKNGGLARVVDLAGKLVLRLNLIATENKINVNHLPNGEYFLEVINNKTAYRTKFLKNE